MRTIPSDLEPYARQAVEAFVGDKAANLTDAVSGVLQGAGLNHAQVRRATESANRLAWKQLSAQDPEVQFDPADPNAVLTRVTPPDVQDTETPTRSQTLGDILQGTSFQLESTPSSNVSPFELAEQAASSQQEALGKAASAKMELLSSFQRFTDLASQGMQQGTLSLDEVAATAQAFAGEGGARALVKEACQKLASFNVEPPRRPLPSRFEVDPDHELSKLAASFKAAAHTAASGAYFSKVAGEIEDAAMRRLRREVLRVR